MCVLRPSEVRSEVRAHGCRGTDQRVPSLETQGGSARDARAERESARRSGETADERRRHGRR